MRFFIFFFGGIRHNSHTQIKHKTVRVRRIVQFSLIRCNNLILSFLGAIYFELLGVRDILNCFIEGGIELYCENLKFAKLHMKKLFKMDMKK
jgi:hypothetical protein